MFLAMENAKSINFTEQIESKAVSLACDGDNSYNRDRGYINEKN